MIHAPLLLFPSLTLERWGVPWLWLNFGEWKGAAHVRGTPQWLWVSRFGCQPQRKQVKRDRRGLGNFHQICYTWRGCLQGDWPAAFPKWMHSFEVVLVLFLFRPTWYVFITLIHWSTTTNSHKKINYIHKMCTYMQTFAAQRVTAFKINGNFNTLNPYQITFWKINLFSAHAMFKSHFNICKSKKKLMGKSSQKHSILINNTFVECELSSQIHLFSSISGCCHVALYCHLLLTKNDIAVPKGSSVATSHGSPVFWVCSYDVRYLSPVSLWCHFQSTDKWVRLQLIGDPQWKQYYGIEPK